MVLVQVLDECHHTHSDHPYNKILKHYRQQSLEDQTSMQVHCPSMLVAHESMHSMLHRRLVQERIHAVPQICACETSNKVYQMRCSCDKSIGLL